MHQIPQPATCTKCGHKGTDEGDALTYKGLAVCPVCVEHMLAMFCGVMKPDNLEAFGPQASPLFDERWPPRD